MTYNQQCLQRMLKRVLEVVRNASHPESEFSAARRLAVQNIVLLAHISKGQVGCGCESRPSIFLAFHFDRLLCLFMIGPQILFSGTVDAAHSFWNVSCQTCYSCSHVSSGKELDVCKNHLRLVRLTGHFCSQQAHAGSGTTY